MVGIMEYILFSMGFLMLRSSLFTSATKNLTICLDGKVTANSVKLNMDTSAIAATTGTCQCNILFHMNSGFHMKSQLITSPKCGTAILLSDESFKPTCTGGRFQHLSYAKDVNSNEQLFIQAKANGVSDLPMSGTIQMKTGHKANFTLECYETTVTRMTTTSTVTTSTITTTTLTTSILKTSLKSSTNGRSFSISTMTADTSMVSKASTTNKDEKIITKQSNGIDTVLTKAEFPVALTAGCATGGVVLVGLVVVAVLIYRQRRKKPKKKSVKKYETSSLQKRERRSIDDENLSMENELYCSTGDLSIDSGIKPNDNPNGIGEGKKNHGLPSNGNIYTLVKKTRNETSPPKPDINHRTAPSGGVYTVVDKL